MKTIILLFSAVAFTTLNSQDYFSDRLFVKVKNEYKLEYSIEKDNRLSKLFVASELISITPVSKHPILSSTYELVLKNEIDLDSIILQLNQWQEIDFVEKVPLYKLFFTPNDPLYSTQWNLSKIQADLAWNLSQGCSNVKIAVTDDAFLMNHEDLVNQWHINAGEIAGNGIDDDGNGYVDDWRGWDAANNDNDPSATTPTNSYFTHGTHVAGILAGSTHSSAGIASIGYNCKMIPIKLGLSSNSSLTGAFQGLDYAVNASGCDVINMSWGGSGSSVTYQTLFNIAKTKGIICVAAAGNSNSPSPMFPASYNHVISVAASANSDARASFSNYGPTIDVTAPGVDIPSCLAGATNAYGNFSGTSMASPLVAGLCALMKCYNPLPADSIETCLKRTCDNINAQNPGFIGQLGAGRINAFQALQCLTKKPVSNFAVLDTFQCIGKSVRYVARSLGIPTLTYNWSFSGGSPTNSTIANPLVTYASNGLKSATLITCNSLGCDTITKTNVVNIDTPKAWLIGRKYTSYNSNPVLVTIKFTGNPTYSVTLSDGTNTWTQSNIKSNPYFFSIIPTKDTSLISISAFSDSLCMGNRYGMDTIYRVTLGGVGSSDCDTTNLNTGKVLHLDFNGNTQDKSGNGNHATNNGATPVAGKNGVANTAYRFDGVNDFMKVLNSPSLGMNSAYTVTCKMKIDGWNTATCHGNMIFFKGNTAPSAGNQHIDWVYAPNAYNGGCLPTLDTLHQNLLPASVTAPSPTAYIPYLNSGKWYCFAVVQKNDTLFNYIDGVMVYKTPNTGTGSNPYDILIGKSDYSSFPYWLNATIDDLRVYNRSLAPSEVKGYCGTCNVTPPPSQDCDTTNLNTGKVLHLDFNGNTQDKSGNGNHATNNGATPVAGKNGVANTAYRFDGVNDFMQIANSTSLNTFSTNKMTMTAIIKPRGFYNGPCKGNAIITKGNSGNVIGNYELRYTPPNSCSPGADINLNNFSSAISVTGACIVEQHTPPPVKIDTWYCVVAVATGDSLITYINGERKFACVYSGSIGSHNLDVFIGRLDNASYPYWLNADVDDIRIYNRVLAPSEVKGYCGTCNVSPTPPKQDCDTNLIVNGGFDAGNTGFNSDYSFCNSSNCLWTFTSNGYSIHSDPSMRHNLFVGSGYGGTGNFAFYNGGLNSLKAWEQTVNVLPNSSYKFSAKLASVYITNPAPIALYINNILIATTSAPASLNNWIDIQGDWNSGSNTTATLTIRCSNTDLSKANNGIDFGIDNISFKQVCSQVCDTTNLNTGKVLHLDFNGSTQDKSGNANHATNNGAIPVSGKSGVANTAYRFDGVNDFMQIANSTSLNTFSTNKMTMTAIIKPRGFYNGPCKNNSIIMKGNTDYLSGNYTLRYIPLNGPGGGCSSTQDTNQNSFVTLVSSAGGCSVSQVHNPPFVKQDTWYCLVGVYTGDSVHTYINGEKKYSCSYSGSIGSHNMDVFIGKLDNASYPYWLNADVDDIRIYNRVLAPSEVKGYCGTCNITPNPPTFICDTARRATYTQCLNDSIQLVLRPGRQYQWSPSTGLSNDTIRNPKIKVSSNRTYLISYISVKGCQLLDTLDIKVQSPAMYSPIPDQLICVGDSVQLTIPIYATNIIWSPNLTISSTTSRNPFFFPATNRTYYLEFRDTVGCIQRDTFVINTKICCSARARFTLSDSDLCFGARPTITNTSKGTINFYNWNFGSAIPSSANTATPPFLTYPAGGNYVIRLIVGNALCQDTMIKTLYLVRFKPQAGQDTASCQASYTVQLGEGSISTWNYLWKPSTYLDDPRISNPVCTILNDSVRYIVEAEDKMSGCKFTDTVTVKTNLRIDSTVSKSRICDKDSLLFNGIYYKQSGRYFYTLKTKDLKCDSLLFIKYLDVQGKDSIVYSPEVHCEFHIDKNGRRRTSSYMSIDTFKSSLGCDSFYHKKQILIFKVTYKDQDIKACNEVVFRGKKYFVSKYNIDSTKIKGPFSGCDSIITRYHIIVLPKPNVSIDASRPNPLRIKDTVTLVAKGGGSYLWLHSLSTNPVLNYKSIKVEEVVYTVRVTDTNNCWDTVSYKIVTEFDKECNYGIPNIFTPNNDQANDIFIPNLPDCADIQLFAVYNRWGEKMFETNENKGWDGYYNNKLAPAGVYAYFIELKTTIGIRIHKGSVMLVR